MGVFFQSLIDVDMWNRAQWRGVAYFVSEDPTLPPALGLAFENEKPGKQIFTDLINRLGKEDVHEELRIAIIEGEIEGKPEGYSVHISSNPAHTIERAKAQGIEVDFDTIFLVSRIHRMTPTPNSPYLGTFKAAYAKQGKYLLVPVSLATGTSQPFTPHFDLAIGKTEILLRRVEDVGRNDVDTVIFATPE